MLRELHGISVRAGESFDLARVRSGLEECIVGQRAAIDRVVASLDNVRLPGRSKNRPLLVLMFAGPTGVGKTYAAECLSESLFGSGTSRFARFNMSELKERHELARLIGAPPGFVGHDREPALFNFVRSKRQGLILLDEMDKAHPEIQDYFLEVFDKGIARDSHGKQEDFRRIVFVITCNLNVQQQFNTKIGFEAQAPAESKTDEAPPAGLAEHFRPEFIARLDGIAHFKKLTIEDLEELLGRRLTAFVEMLQQDRPVTVQISPATRKAVTARCGGQGEDVREFLRKVERVLFRPLQDHLRRETVATQVSITYEDGAVVISDS